jgi:hypothetical protein
MSRKLTSETIIKHKESATGALESYLESLINTGDSKCISKADKLSYWIEDWMKFLDFETSFSPTSLRRYKRGEIIKVHLGFNVGSEEGGLHYAMVLDKCNAKSSPVVTVIPLTSVKPGVDVQNLRKGNVYLGNELFTHLSEKISRNTRTLKDAYADISNELGNTSLDNLSSESLNKLEAKQKEINAGIELLNRMRSEIFKMRAGSIALVNQITTISKIRIYDPKTDADILSGIKMSNEKLDLIDREIMKSFTNFDI